MAFAEDLSLFFDTDEFAVEATATTRAGATLQLKVIFDAPPADAFGAGGMEASQPAVLVATSAVEALRQGDLFVVGARSYRVENTQPDGTGVTRLLLERAA